MAMIINIFLCAPILFICLPFLPYWACVLIYGGYIALTATVLNKISHITNVVLAVVSVPIVLIMHYPIWFKIVYMVFFAVMVLMFVLALKNNRK